MLVLVLVLVLGSARATRTSAMLEAHAAVTAAVVRGCDYASRLAACCNRFAAISCSIRNLSAWVSPILDEVQPRGRRPNVLKHLDESATSVALDIAERNGKRSLHDRIRYLEIARGSALECAACLDVLVARSRLTPDVASQGKATLVRIVSTITKLIERHLRDADADADASTSTSTTTSRNRPSR